MGTTSSVLLSIALILFLLSGYKLPVLVAWIQRAKRIQEFSDLSLWQTMTFDREKIFKILKGVAMLKKKTLLNREKAFRDKYGNRIVPRHTEPSVGGPVKIIFVDVSDKDPEGSEFPTDNNCRTPDIERYDCALRLYEQIVSHDLPHYRSAHFQE